MIPTIGRIVHFYQKVGSKHHGPFAAIVCKVSRDEDGRYALNLAVFDEDGDTHKNQNVPLREAFDGDYCTWPTLHKVPI